MSTPFVPRDPAHVADLLRAAPLCWVVSGNRSERFATPLPLLPETDASGKTKRIPIDYPSILDGKHPEHDLALLPGDLIYVP